MRKDLFAIPIFEEKIDLDRIILYEEEFHPTFESGLLTTMKKQKVKPTTIDYIIEVFKPCLKSLGDNFSNIQMDTVWCNKYSPKDYQGYHIHPHTQWSFIIYETIEESKTMFIHPAMIQIQNQIHSTSKCMPVYYEPNLESGHIIFFPSFLGHQVRPGNTGETIAGNIFVTYCD